MTSKFAPFLAILAALLVAPALSLAGEANAAAPAMPAAAAIFAGGCFWCVESDFDSVKGVLETTNGYIGGDFDNPTYDDVATGVTGHVEAVKVTYDPSRVSYSELLDFYWRHIDPTDGRGQFCDRGSAYLPTIFVDGNEQRVIAEKSRMELAKSGLFRRPIAVEIRDAVKFWPAEAEHQNFYKKNPFRYRFYRAGCGRDARIRQVWGTAAQH